MNAILFLAEWGIRSSILIIIAALLLRALRVKDSSIRLATWVAVLIASLALPVLQLALPSVPLMILQTAPAAATRVAMPAVAIPRIATQTSRPVPLESQLATPSTRSPKATRSFDWLRMVLIIYCLIAAALLARIFTGLIASLRILRRSQVTEIEQIRESGEVSAPVTLGILRPSIVLPPDWREWDTAKLDAVLAHERSHIERNDPAVQLLSSIHQALLWHSPLSWFLNRRIVRMAEDASDDAALHITQDRALYAEVLLDFMRRGVRGELRGVAMARYGSPGQRIDRVLNGAVLSRGITRSGVAAIVAIASPLACFVAMAQPQADPTTPPPAPRIAPPRITPPAPFAQTTPSSLPPSFPRIFTPPLLTSVPPSSAFESEPWAVPRVGSSPQLSAALLAPEPPTEAPPQSQTQSSSTIRRYVIAYGDGSNMSGSWDSNGSPSPNDLRSGYGRHFAWFRQEAHEYVITDAGVMAEIEQAMRPQRDVNLLQNEVNAEQSKVNDLQHDVNQKQNDVNALQRDVNRLQDMINRLQSAMNQGAGDDVLRRMEEAIKEIRASKTASSQNDVNRAQSRVNEAQALVNEEQHKVNGLQQRVNDAQHRASNEIRDRLQEIFESAIDRHLSQQIK